MARPIKDLTGQKFGRWTALSFSHFHPIVGARWNCRCDCGTKRSVSRASLKSGASHSCGCFRNERGAERLRRLFTKHGMRKTRIYNIWYLMKMRCLNRRNKTYSRYGARGITVCDRWLVFENFLADMGQPPSKRHTLDRVDNDGPYSPGNCRWATFVEQANNRRGNHLLIYQGKTLTVTQWARELGVPDYQLWNRIKRGNPIERILDPKKIEKPGDPRAKALGDAVRALDGKPLRNKDNV